MPKYTIPHVTIYDSAKILGLENITFGKNVLIDDFVFVYARAAMKIGNHVHIACFTSITGGAELTLGDFSGVSQGSRILTGTEDFKDWGFGNPTIPESYRNVRRAPIAIGRFSIVGANSVILPGVTIGEGAMVGACSVVTRDLEPWGIYLHNRRIGDRNRVAVMQTFDRYLKDLERSGA
jgi:galactoside O-acetyltransferase